MIISVNVTCDVVEGKMDICYKPHVGLDFSGSGALMHVDELADDTACWAHLVQNNADPDCEYGNWKITLDMKGKMADRCNLVLLEDTVWKLNMKHSPLQLCPIKLKDRNWLLMRWLGDKFHRYISMPDKSVKFCMMLDKLIYSNKNPCSIEFGYYSTLYSTIKMPQIQYGRHSHSDCELSDN